MEHTTRHTTFSGGRRFNSYSLPGFLQGSPFMVFQVMLWFLLFTAHEARQVLSYTRNETYAATDNVPIWDETLEKTERKCQKFHDDRFPTLFFYWPEDNRLFHHCCSNTIDNNLLPRYKYSEYGQIITYAKYRDVGYFDQCLPFWKCRKAYLEIRHTTLYYAYCDTTDMAKLYWNRFWTLTVWKYSLLETTLPWILILEVVVISLALAVFPLTWRLASKNPAKPARWKDLKPTGNIWLKSIWKRLLMDWGHMYLLAMVGNGLFEAMRHQSAYSMQSQVFFAYSMLYAILLVILSCASGMQQLAYWIGSATEPKVLKNWKNEEQSIPYVDNSVLPRSGADPRENGHDKITKVSFAADRDQPLHGEAIELDEVQNICHGDASEDIKMKNQFEIDIDEEKYILEGARQDEISLQNLNAQGKLLRSCCFKKRVSKLTREVSRKYLSVDVFKLGDDYKWQPIATQAAILFALGSFLTFAVDDDSEASNLFAIVLGYLAQAGCLWTGIYAVVVFFQRAAYILKFFMKLWNVNTDDYSQDCN